MARRCRFCAEEIADAAVVCKHCGRDLIPGRNTKSPDATEAGPVSMDTSALLRHLSNEEQDPKVVEQVLSKVKHILTTGEEVKYIAVQKKLVNISPDSVVLTNKRFIIYKPSLTGISFEDYPWRDLHDAKIKETLLGAWLSYQTVHGRFVSIDSLPKAQARRLYALSQEMEEKARVERRERELEDKRAAAGGVVVQSASALAPAPAVPDPLATLQKLKGMLDAGLISQAEYDQKKAEILAAM
jgi:hypothetical protein